MKQTLPSWDPARGEVGRERKAEALVGMAGWDSLAPAHRFDVRGPRGGGRDRRAGLRSGGQCDPECVWVTGQ